MLNYTLMMSLCTAKAAFWQDNVAQMLRKTALFIILTLLVLSIPANAQTELELKKLDATLKQTEQSLARNKTKRQQIISNLQTLEQQIAERTLRFEQTQRKVKTLDLQATELEAERDTLTKRFLHHKQQLSKLLESAYLMGRQSGLKIVLSQEGAQHMTRLNYYARNIADARQSQLDTLTLLQDRIRQKNLTLEKQYKKTARLSTALEEDQRYLNQLKTNRLAMVEQLDQDIDDGSFAVDQLRKRKARLEKLLSEIAVRQKARAARRQAQLKRRQSATITRTTKAKKPPLPAPEKPRSTLVPQGTLPMPAKANIVAHFGDRRAKSGLPWTGILMQGRNGAEIKAISDGEVVYADWLQGYGQMIIVDHGNGVMSLYGHNKRILKAVGDQVRQSDTIATMGDTAGLKYAGLYFEIRQNGIAQDPLKWCRS